MTPIYAELLTVSAVVALFILIIFALISWAEDIITEAERIAFLSDLNKKTKIKDLEQTLQWKEKQEDSY